jgi:phosphoglycerate dehydrogenase-like enzyme
MLNVVVDMRNHEEGFKKLKAIPGLNIRHTSKPNEEGDRPEPSDLIKDAHVWLSFFLPANHEEMKSLKFVQLGSAGYNQLYGKNLVARGIKACNALGVFDVPIAEWNVAMMVNLARNMRLMMIHQNDGIWDRSPGFQTEIRGKTVGFWGYGGIGRETARLAKVMGLNVHVLSRSGKISPRGETYCVPGTGDPEGKLPDRVFGPNEKFDFLKSLDFLILAMPLTGATEGLIGEAELRALKPSCCLLNPARGPIIQEQALLKALREKWFAAAALDTHYHYPMPKDHPLWSFPNVIMTPHISGSAESTKFPERVWDISVQNIQRLQAGKPLLNQLTDAQLNGG